MMISSWKVKESKRAKMTHKLGHPSWGSFRVLESCPGSSRSSLGDRFRAAELREPEPEPARGVGDEREMEDEAIEGSGPRGSSPCSRLPSEKP